MFSLLLLAAAADPAPPALTLSADEQAVVDRTNAERKAADLPPLAASAKLFEAARAHSKNMARQDKLAHELDDKTPTDRVKAAGYEFARLGENVSWNAATPKEVVAQWTESPPHKMNILTKEFTEIGVGVATNDKGEPYWTQVFGTPRE